MRTAQHAAIIVAALTTLATVSGVRAAVTWDGNGSSDNSGNWSVDANWDTVAPVATDDVILPSVTTGTRIVTQDTLGGTTINTLTIAQSNATGINKLSLASNLSIGTNNPYTVSLSGGATVANSVLDLNGFTLIATRAGGSSNFTPTFGGTVNFNAAGSQIAIDLGSANTTPTFTGAVNVTADASIARKSSSTTNQTGNPIVTFSGTSVVNIASGTLNVEYLGRKGDADLFQFNINSGSSTTIASGAALAVKYQASTASANNADYVPKLTNAGAVSQSGSLNMQAARRGAPVTPSVSTIANSGTWTVSGTGATISRLTDFLDATYIAVPVFTNTGTLRGNTALDRLEFNEQVALSNKMTITNDGSIAPGAGTNQSLLTSVGTLELLDTNVTFGATGVLRIDVGGSTAGEYDVLKLATGLTDAAGAGTLDLSAVGDTLRVTLVNGFDPETSPGTLNIPILSYGSVTGTFDNLLINGVAAGPNWSVSYGATSANLVLVPEPATLGLIGLAGLGLIRRRR